MCELMAMSFEKPIRADFSLREFSGRGDANADGWGLGWYPDRSLAIVKEPVRWGSSRFSRFLEKYRHLLSPIYIAHVRHRTTGGEPTHADTQPFSRELRGAEYCFAHNGTVVARDDLLHDRYQPIGDTDSERLLVHLMNLLARRDSGIAAEADWRWLHETLAELNDRGTINLLFSDGKRLCVYHDRSGHKGLSFRSLIVKHHQKRCFADAEISIRLGTRSVRHGYVVASQPLSADGWLRFERGELLVFEEGQLRYSSHRPLASLIESASSALATTTRTKAAPVPSDNGNGQKITSAGSS